MAMMTMIKKDKILKRKIENLEARMLVVEKAINCKHTHFNYVVYHCEYYYKYCADCDIFLEVVTQEEKLNEELEKLKEQVCAKEKELKRNKKGEK